MLFRSRQAEAVKAAEKAALPAKYPFLTVYPRDGSISGHAQGAKNVRKHLAHAFPGIKFSVRSKSFSGGDSIDVGWENGPTAQEVDAILDLYEDSTFDGMQDLSIPKDSPFPEVFGGAMFVHGSRSFPDTIEELVSRSICASYGVPYAGRYTVLEGEDRQLVVADIPGLIEGASEGAGLGHDFLAHVERTRLLVHVLDIAPELTAGEGADAAVNHATIERELAAHDERLAELPRVLALSKADLVSEQRARKAVAEWQRRLGGEVPVIATSSATGAGLGELAGELLRRVAPASASAVAGGAEPSAGVDNGHALAPPRAPGGGSEELAEHMVFRPAGDRLAAGAGFSVERLGPRSFAVRGRGIERLLARYDVDNEDAMTYVEGRLRRIDRKSVV